MGTKAKIVVGYTDHMNYWNNEKEYLRHYDGYPEAIIPVIKGYDKNKSFEDYIQEKNEDCEYDSHKFIETELYSVDYVDFIYYIDVSDRGNIKCSVLGLDSDFYRMYGISNYEVVCVFDF